MNTQKQIFLIVALFFVFMGGCTAYTIIELPYRAPLQAEWTMDESVERGALLFANNCRTCHGIKGEGGVGPVLNKPEFQDQDPLILKANRSLLRTTLTCGRAGTLMPAWLDKNGGALNAIQIEHLIDLITAPAEEGVLDEEGNPTNTGWVEAVHFAHNLNHHTTALIGGDTLDTIAKAHGIGIAELLKANPGISAQGFLKQGSKIKIPGFRYDPDGYSYTVYNDNETVTKIVDSQHVGAVIIADLNELAYKFKQSKGRATFDILDGDGRVTTGLFPGDELKLPEGATYTVVAEDTLDDIAARHNVSVSEIRSLNSQLLQGVDATKPLDYERRLKLPSNAVVIVQEGQTLALVAKQHGLEVAALASANGITQDAVLVAGDRLSLPPDSRYAIQTGDTLESIARAHGVDAQAIAGANGLQPNEPIDSSVVLKLPKIDRYVVRGDDLDAIADTMSNVTAESLGEANGVPANAVLRVGQTLKIPEDAWGSAPPDARNPGTACVQHAVPNSVFQTLPGVGTPVATATAPANVSKDVKVDGNANDWTVIADGTKLPPNKGAVLIAKGSAVPFTSVAGLHTITINGKKDGDDIRQGQSRTVTFNDVGAFKITCDYHPDMIADIFVQ